MSDKSDSTQLKQTLAKLVLGPGSRMESGSREENAPNQKAKVFPRFCEAVKDFNEKQVVTPVGFPEWRVSQRLHRSRSIAGCHQ